MAAPTGYSYVILNIAQWHLVMTGSEIAAPAASWPRTKRHAEQNGVAMVGVIVMTCLKLVNYESLKYCLCSPVNASHG